MVNTNGLKITLLSILAITLLSTTSVFATEHYEITTSSSISNETYSDYSQSGTGYGGVFYIYNGGSLTLTDVIFSTNSAYYGGAIYNGGALTIEDDVAFNGNTGTYGGVISNIGRISIDGDDISFSSNTAQSGGAIYQNQSGILNIGDDILFFNNKATGSGGAIWVGSGSLNIGNNVVFNKNNANSYGGAIYNETEMNINIGSNTVFSSNKAVRGGAIYNDSVGILNIEDGAVFSGNKATTNGGAIYNYGIINIGDNAKFSGNEASSSGYSSFKYGGAIYNTGTVNIGDGAEFRSNKSSTSGGAIYNTDNGMFQIGDNAKFLSNDGGTSVGAIVNSSSAIFVIGDNVNFSSNTSFSGTGAISNGGTLTIGDNATFYGNKSSVSTSGGINNSGTVFIGANSFFSNNYAGGDGRGGGAICNTGTMIISSNAYFTLNYADTGDAIYNDSNGSITFEDGAVFEANRGGAIYNAGILNFVANTNNVEFTGNAPNTYSIAYAITGTGTVNLWASDAADIIFNDRITGSNVININASTTTLTANGKVILNNNMEAHTGTVNLYGGEIEFKAKTASGSNVNTNNFFRGNINLSSGTLNILNNAIDNITISTFTSTENVNLKFDMDLSNNTGDNFTVTNSADGTLNLTAMNILNANQDSGQIVLFNNENAPELNILTNAIYGGYEYHFTNGDIAGVINYEKGRKLTFKETVNETSTPIRSYSLSEQETVPADLGQLGGEQLTIFGNGYNINGNGKGGINVSENQTLNVEGTMSISNFQSESDGGFLYNDGGTINIENNVTLSLNSATNGGAIYNNNGTVNIQDGVTISSNDGGAIYNDHGTINIIAKPNNVVFTGNTANGTSNAIHDNGGTINLWANYSAYKDISIIFNDRITSEDSSSVMNINSPDISTGSGGSITLNEDMSGYTGTVNLYKGEIYLQAKTEAGSNINTNKFFSGNINVQGARLNTRNNAIDNITVSTLTLTNAYIYLDTDLSNNTIDNFTVTNSVTGTLSLYAINILGVDQDSGQITLFNNENAPTINVATIGTYGGYEYTFTNSDVAGVLNYEKTGLVAKTFKEYVNALEPEVRSYSLSEDEDVRSSLYDLGGKQLTIFGNGYNVLGSNVAGIYVGENKTLDIVGVENWSGFTNRYGAIQNEGTLNIAGTNFSNNSGQDIINNGNLTLSGTASSFATGINGNGNTAINGVSIDLGDSAFIKQSLIEIKEEGTLTANASNVSGDISNYGTLIFTEGTIESAISGTGNLEITGTITNSNSINQNIITIDGMIENNSAIRAEDIYINGIFKLAKNGTFYNATNSIITDGAILDLQNKKRQAHNFGNLTVNSGTVNLAVDADLRTRTMDTISADESSVINGTIDVKAINILSDNKKTETTEILFTNSDVLKDKITSITNVTSKLYKYKVSYNDGYFRFTNIGKNLRPEANPIILESAVAGIVGGNETQVTVTEQAFGIYNQTKKIWKAQSNENLYTSASDSIFETDNGIERNLWLRPYAVAGTVKFGDFDVDNTLFGTLAGIDLPFDEEKQVSVYIGYAGSTQKYEDIKMNQNGYVIGATGLMMKENYYLGLTANVILNKVESESDYGTDDFDMNMFTIAAKAGYNFDLGNNWILEPNLMLMFGNINTQEYETSQEAKIDGNSMTNIMVKPQVKARLQLKDGWQPYGLLGYSLNINDKVRLKAEGEEFDTDKVNDFFELGVGVNKDFIDTPWSCYGQLAGRFGGRTGVSFNLGIKYRF